MAGNPCFRFCLFNLRHQTPELGSLVSVPSSEIGFARSTGSIFPGVELVALGGLVIAEYRRHHLVVCLRLFNARWLNIIFSTLLAYIELVPITDRCSFATKQSFPLPLLWGGIPIEMSASTAQQVVRRAQLYGRLICSFTTRTLKKDTAWPWWSSDCSSGIGLGRERPILEYPRQNHHPHTPTK